MSHLRKIMESPPKNTGKRTDIRPQEPNPDVWYTAGFKDTTPPPAKKKRIVPEQINFTESDSVVSMRAQIQGLRTTNQKLQDKLKEANNNVNISLCNHAALQNQYERQERRHMDEKSQQKQIELTLLANCRAYEREKVKMQDAFDMHLKGKESEVRRLQREFNDAVNALLASDVE